MPGAYRKLIARPRNFNASLRTYTREDENILESERDTLPELACDKERKDEKESTNQTEAKIALIVEFELPTG